MCKDLSLLLFLNNKESQYEYTVNTAAKRIKKKHFVLIKGSFYQADITVLNLYADNSMDSQYSLQTLAEQQGK